MTKKKLFQITDEQKKQITHSIMRYIDHIVNADVKQDYLNKLENDKNHEFLKSMIHAFAEIMFMSQTVIISIQKPFDYRVFYNKIIKDSQNDIFLIQELKTYLINNLISEETPVSLISPQFKEKEIKMYRSVMAEFKRDYLSLFE